MEIGSKFVGGMYVDAEFLSICSESALVIRLVSDVVIRLLVGFWCSYDVILKRRSSRFKCLMKFKTFQKEKQHEARAVLMVITSVIVQCLITMLSHFQVHLRNRLQELSACFAFFHN